MIHHRERGAALVEFALILPLFILVLIGIVELGRLAYFTIEVANAAHAGAQYGALGFPNAASPNMSVVAKKDGQNSISDFQTVAQYVCACWNPSTGVETPSVPSQNACTSPCATGGHSLTYAQVSVTGTIHTLFNYAMLGLPSQWTVTRTAVMRATQAE
jgi:Flp pilus assembly protein TadG